MRFAVILACLLLCGGGIAMAADEYTGSDAGFMVLSLGEKHSGYTSFMLAIKRTDGKYDQLIKFLPNNMFVSRKPDYQGDERGIVEVRSLEPGAYVIYNYQVGMAQENWSSRKDFAVPFRIVAGQATYIGDFAAIGDYGKNFFGMTVPDGAHFVVSDQSARDIPIAQGQHPSLPKPLVSIVDPGQASPYLVSAQTGSRAP